jgi:hypothetical protein
VNHGDGAGPHARRRARKRGGVTGSDDAAARVRTLLLRGDNVMKSARPEALERALVAFEEARVVAAGDGVDPRVRDLVERRIESLRELMHGPPA